MKDHAKNASAHRDWLMGLIHDDEFMMFMQEEPERYVPREAFLEKTFPCGLDAELAWELVSFMRRMAGTPSVREHVPTKSKTLNELSFWSMSETILPALNNIVGRVGEHSQLWKTLEPLFDHGRISQPFVEDLTAAAFRDGLEAEYEDVRAIVFGDRAPCSSSEQVIANAFSLIKCIKSPETLIDGTRLSELQRLLLNGVGSLPVPSYKLPKAPIFEPISPHCIGTNDETARKLSSTNTWGIHPLFSVLMDSDIIFTNQPFARCNGVMEVILRNILLTHIGVPGLRFVPFSKLRLDWERGLVPPENAPFQYGWAVLSSDFGIDCTPYLLQIIHFLERGVDKLEKTIVRIEKDDSQHKSLIARDFRLSHRQKQLLSDMIDNPHLVTEVGSYADRFEIATSTARDDLNRLVEFKFCFTEFRGKKQVFWPRPDLTQMIEQTTSQ